jgi:c-di-GMP-binding flagellar brake protein YcgR
MEEEIKETKYRYGTVNFEKRMYPRFNIDLPIEYSRSDSIINVGKVANASEGGLLLYLPEPMEIGQQFKGKLFFSEGSEMNVIEMVVQVVWKDIQLREGGGDYRTGVKFVYISPQSLEKLKNFISKLSGR